jgi:hypothetical protein
MAGLVAVGVEAMYEEKSQPGVRVKVTRGVTIFVDPLEGILWRAIHRWVAV